MSGFDDGEEEGDRPVPSTWRLLSPRERWQWWSRLWSDSVLVCERYDLHLRAGWWRRDELVERMEAFCRWLWLLDSGHYDQPYSAPPGKLALLDYIGALRAELGGGGAEFDPAAEWAAYARQVIAWGAEPAAGVDPDEVPVIERLEDWIR